MPIPRNSDQSADVAREALRLITETFNQASGDVDVSFARIRNVAEIKRRVAAIVGLLS